MCMTCEFDLSGNCLADANTIAKGVLEAIGGNLSGKISISINIDCLLENGGNENKTTGEKFDDLETMLSPKDVMGYLDMGKNSVYALFKKKKFNAYRIEGQYRVKKSDLFKYLESECVPRQKRIKIDYNKPKTKFKDGEIMLTANDIMEYLGVGDNTAYKFIKKLKLRNYKIGGKSMVKKADFLNALELYRVGNNTLAKERVNR